jgi:hypothetical protein
MQPLESFNGGHGGDDDREYDLFSIAAHEAGHGIISGHFGLFLAVFVAGRGFGRCFHYTGSKLENASVGWGGNFAENILDVPSRRIRRPGFRLTRETLALYVSESSDDTFSPPDLQEVASYPDRMESALTAYSILIKRRKALEKFTEYLAKIFRQLVFNSRLEGASGEVDEFLKNLFSDRIRWIEAKNNFRDRCKLAGVTNSERLKFEMAIYDAPGHIDAWIVKPRKFLSKLLKQKPNHRQ